ncbi:MAG: MmcQ/YjbR family DNA-binding protein [Sodalis sp. (in: enterobacteria)]|uniref:MmcQ/YjbR family DNA-binding protein n=1 Tax=Sodalis sp. (in: enterobacteria) TaxID=1898979 RepID=UPI003F34B45F
MDQSTLLSYCMTKPGVVQSGRQEWQANQVKVGEVMFAMTDTVDGRPAVSLKSSAEMAEVLRSAFATAIPGERLNGAHWSTLFLDGDIPDSQLYQLVDASWQWAMGNGQWAMGNGQWAMGNGRWPVCRKRRVRR